MMCNLLYGLIYSNLIEGAPVAHLKVLDESGEARITRVKIPGKELEEVAGTDMSGDATHLRHCP